jgi:hypothetical protein
MALLFMDSFDHYVTADLLEKWSTSAVTGAASAISIGAVGRRSTSGLRWATGTVASNSGNCTKVLAPGDATCVIGFALNVASGTVGTAGLTIAALRDGSTTQVALRLNQDLSLSVLRGPNASGPSILGTTSSPITAGSFVYIEWKTTIHNTAGTTEVRLNGAPVLSLGTLDTQNTGTTQYTAVMIGNVETIANQVASSKTVDWDDLYVCDGTGSAPLNTFLGDVRVDVRSPTAAGATTGWTPSAGANYQTVDDAAPDDDTTYTTATTVGLTDTFVYQDAPVAGATIFGLQHVLSAKKMDAGTCSLAPVTRIGTTDYPLAAQNPSTTYAYYLAIQSTNPATSATWVDTEFNAAEFGYKKTA